MKNKTHVVTLKKGNMVELISYPGEPELSNHDKVTPLERKVDTYCYLYLPLLKAALIMIFQVP